MKRYSVNVGDLALKPCKDPVFQTTRIIQWKIYKSFFFVAHYGDTIYLNHYNLRLFQHTFGAHPLTFTNRLQRDSFHSWLEKCLGCALGVCCNFLGYKDPSCSEPI